MKMLISVRKKWGGHRTDAVRGTGVPEGEGVNTGLRPVFPKMG